MAFRQRRRFTLALTLLVSIAIGSPVQAAIDFEPSWSPADYEDVRAKVLEWTEQAEVEESTAKEISELWPAKDPGKTANATVLDRLARALALGHPEAAKLVEHCATPFMAPPLPDVAWLTTDDLPSFARNNLRLHYARWLAQSGLYDEVLDQLADLRPDDVADPAALLFYQMAAYHQLVMPDESRAALVQLMEREDELPQRFRQVAQLVRRDLEALEDESLNHIARRMRDVRRRLDYGRAGEKVQAVEKSVLDSLDKKIKDLEKQQQQQQQSSVASGGSSQSSKPMEDSRPAELKGPMQVDRKDIGHQSGWGDLPPKEREQAMQQVGREFPAHYQELIEDYFRELAAEPSDSTE
jgi:hypothetical protein